MNLDHLLTNCCVSSQVHDIHPAHAFLLVLEKPARSKGEPEYLPTTVTMQDTNEEQCTLPASSRFYLTRVLLRSHEAPRCQVRTVCTHLHESLYLFIFLYRRSCLQDILGARFHCAICDSVDICSNCESAGLPGNLDSSDGGHLSSHIMIKVCTRHHSPRVFAFLTSNRFPTHSKPRKFRLLRAAPSISGPAGMPHMFSPQATRNPLQSILLTRKLS